MQAEGNCLPGIPEGTYIGVTPHERLEPLCLCVFTLKDDPVGRGKLFLGHSDRIDLDGRICYDVVLLGQIEPHIVHVVRRNSLYALHRAKLPPEAGVEIADAMVGFAVGGYVQGREIKPINPDWRPDILPPNLGANAQASESRPFDG